MNSVVIFSGGGSLSIPSSVVPPYKRDNDKEQRMPEKQFIGANICWHQAPVASSVGVHDHSRARCSFRGQKASTVPKKAALKRRWLHSSPNKDCTIEIGRPAAHDDANASAGVWCWHMNGSNASTAFSVVA